MSLIVRGTLILTACLFTLWPRASADAGDDLGRAREQSEIPALDPEPAPSALSIALGAWLVLFSSRSQAMKWLRVRNRARAT
jgi:hypothetical protein